MSISKNYSNKFSSYNQKKKFISNFNDKPETILISKIENLKKKYSSLNSIGKDIDLNKLTSNNCHGINYYDKILYLYTYENFGKYLIFNY